MQQENAFSASNLYIITNLFHFSDWFRFDVDDEDLQDEPLQIRVMDYDTYSANDAIGKVSLSLNPLLLSDNKTSSSQKCNEYNNNNN